MNKTELRPIRQIAMDIKKEWKKVYFGAVPYLDAMLSLSTTADRYGEDDGHGIVLYFLSNANTFRGGNAKVLKEELKVHLKERR